VTSTATLETVIPASQKVEKAIVTETKPDTDKVADAISPTPVTHTSNVASSSSTSTPEIPTKEPEMRDLPEVVLVPPADASHIHPDDEVQAGNGQKPLMTGQGGRESVWQKLSNRIKVANFPPLKTPVQFHAKIW